MTWYRVDNRLIHGQVIEAWLPYTKAKRIIVVNDCLKKDETRQLIVSLAVPETVDLMFCSLDEFPACQQKFSHDSLILFADCADALAVFNSGVHFDILNIANLHYGPGKRQFCVHVALDEHDEHILSFLKDQNVKLDFRCVPNEANALAW